MGNVFENIPSHLPAELTEVLVEHESVRIERIVSTGHTTPEGKWYDQDEHEWVVVLKGSATLSFEGDPNPVDMQAGDFINIPAQRKHRVEQTSADEPTVWLAVFYR